MRLVTAAEMREMDRRTIEDLGLPGLVLMEVAGRGVADAAAAASRARGGGPIAVLAGRGNNGGDGFVAARHLHSRGFDVTCYLAAGRDRLSPDAATNLALYERVGGAVRLLDDETRLAEAAPDLARAAVVVDALLGTGLERPLAGHLRAVVEAASDLGAYVVAVDVPTGLHADSGRVLGAALAADETVTFGAAKVGLVGYPGFLYAGRLRVVDIGIPAAVAEAVGATALAVGAGHARKLLPSRSAGGHKGTFGHLLLVAGSRDKSGAALLAGEAALRAGCGLATIAAPPSALAGLAAKTREVMLAPLGEPGADLGDPGTAPPDPDALLGPLLAGKRAVAVGPGIPRTGAMDRLVRHLVATCDRPVVVDADGLNALAGDLAPLAAAPAPRLLTPHPGEMARLTGLTTAAIQEDRLAVARAFAREHGVYVALKGARTVVATPAGRAYVNLSGNAGLGTAGTGDVLTGVVGSLLAQGAPAEAALVAGVHLHGAAGDDAAARVGERGMVASDVIAAVARVLAAWEA